MEFEIVDDVTEAEQAGDRDGAITAEPLFLSCTVQGCRAEDRAIYIPEQEGY